ncbi:unnamed protein product [Thelazia callipaeda]|uniref:POU domain, class 6, transcription factor 2 n=1 Tax=Thelazia callipaeda TaxID=103827 RepID=A0A0N5D1C3_THECL|nr:unnamed protein product [Thelazia callipaeda]
MVPDMNQSVASLSPVDQQRHRIPLTIDNKQLLNPLAYASSSLSAVATMGNFSAAVAAAAAVQTASPFLLAAALGLQSTQNTLSAFPWLSNAQSFTAMLPYLRQLQTQTQIALAQQLAVAQQAAANMHQQLKTANAASASLVTQPQWLSPPPSVPPQISVSKQASEAASSPSPLAGLKVSAVSQSKFREISLRPRVVETQLPSSPSGSSCCSSSEGKQRRQFLFDEDMMIDSLMEERKDLSEKESIAVAVLAGMAAYER